MTGFRPTQYQGCVLGIFIISLVLNGLMTRQKQLDALFLSPQLLSLHRTPLLLTAALLPCTLQEMAEMASPLSPPLPTCSEFHPLRSTPFPRGK